MFKRPSPEPTIYHTMTSARPAVLLLLALLATHAQAQDGQPARLVGDIGAGIDAAARIGRSSTTHSTAVPYLNFDYGPVFARVDTFGYKLLPVGYGSLELVARAMDDGYTPVHTQALRHNSMPAGLGTLQTTPVGAVFLNAFHDLGKSGGNLLDLIYAAEIDRGPFAFYPQAGVEYRSRAYVDYFYGSPAAGYRPGAARNGFAGLFVETHLSGHWYVNLNVRHIWLGGAIASSPLVGRHSADTGLLALSYRFD